MEEMAHHTEALAYILAQMLIFFGVAGIAVPMLQRFHITPVLGYLLCGVVIGPYALGGWVEDYPWLSYVTVNETHTVHLLGELGVIAMMFMIGLELSFQRLKELKHYVLGLGSLQILLTGVCIAGVAYGFGNSTAASLLLGASLALSSTAIVMQLLNENHLSNRNIGSLCFSILLMQDLAVVPIVVLASAFAVESSQSIPVILIESFFIATGAITAIYLVGRIGMRPLLRLLSFTRNPEWLMAFVLFMVAISAAVTQSAGLSAALGAFLAGLLIAETDCHHAVEVIISPLKGLLLGIFFLSVGMMIDVREIWRDPFWLFASVAGIFTIKACILYPLCRWFHVPVKRSIEASIMLSQPGEFAFLILGAAAASGLMPREDVQFFLLVTAIAMFFTPLLFKISPFISRFAEKVTHHEGEEEHYDVAESRVLIAGFGRVGQKIARTLEKQSIPYIAIENDLERVRKLKKEGYHLLYGDAARAELWHNIGAQNASAVVVTVDDYEAGERIVHAMHQEWPLLPVIMRARDVSDTQRLYSIGAKHVIPELEEASRQMTQCLFEELGMSPEEIFDTLRRDRQEEAAISL